MFLVFFVLIFSSLILKATFTRGPLLEINILIDLKMKTNPVECEVCTQAIKYLDSKLTEKSTEEEIKKEVISLCSHLPTAIENEVIKYLFTIMESYYPRLSLSSSSNLPRLLSKL